MNKLKFIVLLLIVFSCSKKSEVLEGDLSFKLIEFVSFYGKKDFDIKNFEKQIDSLRFSKNTSKQDLEFIEAIDKLKKNNLLQSPWFYLKTKDSIIKIFLSENDYDKIKKFSKDDLIKANKKVKLKLDLELKDKEIYVCNKIISLEVVEGKTEVRK